MGRPSATKKQTTTTSATVDETIVAENSQNVVVDNAEIEEKTKSKTRKVVDDEKVVEPLQDTDDIEVIALIPNISYKDNKTLDFYEWKNIGDIEEIPFEVLKNMYRNHRGYFRNLWLKPLDDRVIDFYNELETEVQTLKNELAELKSTVAALVSTISA